MTEEDDVVVAEGTVHCARKDGGFLDAVFCDVFVMQDAKIKHLTSYLMEVKGRVILDTWACASGTIRAISHRRFVAVHAAGQP